VELTEALMKTLPQLFAKNQADERRIAEVIVIPQLMRLDTYAEMGMKKVRECIASWNIANGL
jgi:cohesin complex subunit SA-1/2